MFPSSIQLRSRLMDHQAVFSIVSGFGECVEMLDSDSRENDVAISDSPVTIATCGQFDRPKRGTLLQTTVLVIDDDRSLHHLITRSLEKLDMQVVSAYDGATGVGLVTSSRPDVVLLDVRLPKKSGLELFSEIRQLDRRLPVVFITADSESETAIEAIRLGAFDYLRKPLNLSDLNQLVQRAVETRRMMSVPVAIPIRSSDVATSDSFAGAGPAMLEVYKTIGRVAGQDVAVLIRGESGTGKELVARAIYQYSRRASEAFLAINCAAIPENLLESELFGHEKGAFTGADQRRIGKFEQCNGGSLFLDEIGDMPQLLQGKVLRLLQDQKFERVGGNTTISTNVRLIAATNRPLEQMVEDGMFREDLLYRLNTITIRLPPLRGRVEDIPVLLERFVSKFAQELNRPELEGIAPSALALLQTYRWPGNIRELQSVVRNAILNTSGTVIVPDSLPPEVRNQGVSSASGATAPTAAADTCDLAGFVGSRLQQNSQNLYGECLEYMEKYLLTQVLRETQGNQSRAAEILGITRGKVRDRVAAFGIVFEKDIRVQ
jgi:DNA-binding NtrC family response regulator